GGQEYKKVLFSVTDRSGNDNKVLISKDFVGKELDALIDVTKNKIADDGIEVEYVSEGFKDWAGNKLKNAGNAIIDKSVNAGRAIKNAPGNVLRRAKEMAGGATDAKSTASKAKIGPDGKQMYKVKTKGVQQKGSWIDRFYDASQRFKKWVNGQGTLFDDLEQFVEGPALLEKFLKSDADIIKKEVTKQAKLFDKLQVNVSDIHVYKILDFLGGTCVAGKYVDELENKEKLQVIKHLKNAQKALEDLSSQAEKNGATGKEQTKAKGTAAGASATGTAGNEENEESLIKEADEAPTAPTTPQTTGQTSEQPAGQPTSTNKAANANNKDPQAKIEELTKEAEKWKDKLQTIKGKEEGRDFFVIYYVAFGSTLKGEKLALGKDALEPISNFVLQNGKAIMANRVSQSVIENFATIVKDTMSKANTRGMFVCCTGPNIPRPITLGKKVLIGENFDEIANEKLRGKQAAAKKAAETFIAELEKNLEYIKDDNIPNENLELDIEKLKNYTLQDAWKVININLASMLFDDFIAIIKNNQDKEIFEAFLYELGVHSAEELSDKWSKDLSLEDIKNALDVKIMHTRRTAKQNTF
ncbi:MAG: hypothetical protein IKT93_04295, partial [Clostridia bacterium]|nr:hypothetical protein [Clostridia bacterium]